MRLLLSTLLAILSLCVGASPAAAHGMRTAYLELVETKPGTAMATFKSTVADPLAAPSFPEGCTTSVSEDASSSYTRSFVVQCAQPLAGREVGVDGLGPVLSEAVVRVTLHDGEAQSAILTPERTRLSLRGRMSSFGTLLAYLKIGVVHIATGVDHLLFLLALVLYLRRARAVLLAETAFTVSHTLSFSATALGLLSVSSQAAEACIALSLVLLASEVLRAQEQTPRALAGAASALVFGLVHGLGFAGGLSEIGVPSDAAAVALLGFGLGVELGQLLFLLFAMLTVHGLQRVVRPTRLSLAGAYATGAVGAYWLMQRLWLCFA